MNNPKPIENFDAETPPASDLSREVSTGHLQLPSRCFYWSVLDTHETPHLSRNLHAHATRAMLDDRFQVELPLPIEQVATSYAATQDGSVIACGLEIEQLQSELGNHASLLTLTPDSLPPRLQDQFPDVSPMQLNLLIASHEPHSIRALRAANRRTMLAILAAGLALATFGVLRRSSHDRSQLIAVDTSARAALSEVEGSQRDFDLALLSLQRERDRLVSTRTMQASRGLPVDAARALAALLAAWPPDLEVRTQSVAATSQGVTIAAEVNDQADAETLSKALAAVPDWTLQSPRTHATGKAVRFDASLQPKGGTR